MEEKSLAEKKNKALRQAYVTMLAEKGEPVQVENNGIILLGYKVVAGLSEPRTFFPSQIVRAQVESLKMTWQEKVKQKTQVVTSLSYR